MVIPREIRDRRGWDAGTSLSTVDVDPGVIVMSTDQALSWLQYGVLTRISRTSMRASHLTVGLWLEAAGVGTARAWLGLQTAFDLAQARASAVFAERKENSGV